MASKTERYHISTKRSSCCLLCGSSPALLIHPKKFSGILSFFVHSPPAGLISWSRLLTTAWNNGVYKYRLMKFDEAEKWMGLAFKYLQHYPGKTDLESEMHASYSHVGHQQCLENVYSG